MSSQVEQLRLLQELNNDGLKMARVYEKQAEVISDPRSEILIAGGNRGSKTFCSASVLLQLLATFLFRRWTAKLLIAACRIKRVAR